MWITPTWGSRPVTCQLPCLWSKFTRSMFEECLYWLFQSNEFTLPHEDYTHFAVKCQLIGTLSEHSQQDFGSKSNLSESCWWICVQFCLWLQWPVTLTHLFFPLLFSCSLDSSCVSHIWDVWLFVLPKHPLGLACVPKPKGARNMLYKSVRTDRIFFFALEERTTKDVSFKLKLITILRMIQFVWHQFLCSCLCAFTFKYYSTYLCRH